MPFVLLLFLQLCCFDNIFYQKYKKQQLVKNNI